MNEAVRFLRECPAFFLATVQGEKPKLRPFGAVMEYKDRIYFSTSNQKEVFRQIKLNPQVEISGVAADGKWIRLSGKAVVDGSMEARVAMLEANPALNGMYKLGDDQFEVFYLANPQGWFYRLGENEPIRIQLKTVF
ncbi:MAG: pyridoxamine 5'-phosphate oxidase family protein [Peptococcaceae bacterium]|jgi:uncharacterized pyridoxamine 5'-phosphate oxidase family protein|nr:pyridoxamine 5'-phosphate oxidase family protein [Peptococcaceae bacterium]